MGFFVLFFEDLFVYFLYESSVCMCIGTPRTSGVWPEVGAPDLPMAYIGDEMLLVWMIYGEREDSGQEDTSYPELCVHFPQGQFLEFPQTLRVAVSCYCRTSPSGGIPRLEGIHTCNPLDIATLWLLGRCESWDGVKLSSRQQPTFAESYCGPCGGH